MRRFIWPLLIVLLCLPLILLATGVRLPWLNWTDAAEPEPVPAGDFEIVWFNTTTSGATWERFVAGIHRAQQSNSVMIIDDSRAYPRQSLDTPEVVVGWSGRPNRLHFRWYKLSSQNTEEEWIGKLARRSAAPLAIIGGASSDRARDLALALQRQSSWHGDRPLLFLTNATAQQVYLSDDPGTSGTMTALLDLYPGRTFRCCFSNKQMAEALLDFIWRKDATPNLALGSGLLSTMRSSPPAAVISVAWQDDPFSSDMLEQFNDALPAVLQRHQAPMPRMDRWEVPYSVGGNCRPNTPEAAAAASILKELQQQPDQHTLLLIPTVAAPARRLLRTLCEADPQLGRRVVAVNGDGLGANALLRDSEYVWPIRSLPIPFLIFSHANPVAWDDRLRPPSSTDDVLHVSEIVRLIVDSAMEPVLVTGADEMANRLLQMQPSFFEKTGNRRGGTGEFILAVEPKFETADPSDSSVQVWRRNADRRWIRVPWPPHRGVGE